MPGIDWRQAVPRPTMPRITLSIYECEHDLLPAVCAKCGAPAEDRVLRKARYLKDDWALWRPFSVVFGLIFLPAFGMWLLVRFGREIPIRIPLCGRHLDDYEWRDRVFLRMNLPIWTAVVVLLEVGAVVAWHMDFDQVALICILSPALVAGLSAVADALTWRTAVRGAASAKGERLRLLGVHENFVAALVEDRARARISDPDRRSKGDIQADFDDEPV